MARPGLIQGTFQALLRRLVAGGWRPGERIPACRVLAAEFGISLPTLLKALRRAERCGLLEIRVRRPILVRPGAVELAAHLLDRQAKRTSRRRVAVLIPEFYVPVQSFYRIITGAVLQEARRQVQASIVPWSLGNQLADAESLARRGYDAALCIAFKLPYLPGLSQLHRQKFPTVMFHRRFPGLNLPAVLVDQYHAAQDLAARLVALGHRNLCMVSGQSGAGPADVGFPVAPEGWATYLREQELLDRCALPLYVLPPLVDPYGLLFERLLRGDNRVTALVFEHTVWARTFLRDPRLAALRIPEDLSVAALDPVDHTPEEFSRVPLTVAQMDLKRTAECLVEMLLEVLAGNLHPSSIRVPMALDLTDSIGPAPG